MVQPHANRVGPCRVFICYRRSDTGDEAKSIYDALVERYDRNAVFMDVDTLPPGADFHKELKTAIGQSRAVLVLIGRSWLQAARADHRRRIDDRGDKVRWEIRTALRYRASTIPVLLQAAEVWDLASRTMIGRPLTSHSAPVTAVTTVPVDGRVRVVTGSADGTVRLSDLPT